MNIFCKASIVRAAITDGGRIVPCCNVSKILHCGERASLTISESGDRAQIAFSVYGELVLRIRWGSPFQNISPHRLS